jgi:hypothetical protein
MEDRSNVEITACSAGMRPDPAPRPAASAGTLVAARVEDPPVNRCRGTLRGDGTSRHGVERSSQGDAIPQVPYHRSCRPARSLLSKLQRPTITHPEPPANTIHAIPHICEIVIVDLHEHAPKMPSRTRRGEFTGPTEPAATAADLSGNPPPILMTECCWPHNRACPHLSWLRSPTQVDGSLRLHTDMP